MNIRDYRQKIYYPDSQIVKNLFTNGREFMLLRNYGEIPRGAGYAPGFEVEATDITDTTVAPVRVNDIS